MPSIRNRFGQWLFALIMSMPSHHGDALPPPVNRQARRHRNSITRKLKNGTIFLLAGIMLFLNACTDRGQCLSSHEETLMQPQYMTTCTPSGNTTICQQTLMGIYPLVIVQCDKWEFPDGKPKKQKL